MLAPDLDQLKREKKMEHAQNRMTPVWATNRGNWLVADVGRKRALGERPRPRSGLDAPLTFEVGDFF